MFPQLYSALSYHSLKLGLIFTIIEKLFIIDNFVVAKSSGFFYVSSKALCSFGFCGSTPSFPHLVFLLRVPYHSFYSNRVVLITLLFPFSLGCLCWWLLPFFWKMGTFPRLELMILLSFWLFSLSQGCRSFPSPLCPPAVILPISVHPSLPLSTIAPHVPPGPFPSG